MMYYCRAHLLRRKKARPTRALPTRNTERKEPIYLLFLWPTTQQKRKAGAAGSNDNTMQTDQSINKANNTQRTIRLTGARTAVRFWDGAGSWLILILIGTIPHPLSSFLPFHHSTVLLLLLYYFYLLYYLLRSIYYYCERERDHASFSTNILFF